MKTLSNVAMKPSLLKRRLETNRGDKMNQDQSYFQQLGENVKRQGMDITGQIQQNGKKIVKASYEGHLLYDCRVSCYANGKNIGQVNNGRAGSGKVK